MGEKIVEKTLAEQVCDKLREEIISGEIPANKRLTVKEICEKYGVNTMPVREAFNMLCGEKILRNDAYKGATVLGLDVEYVSQIYELQSALEISMLKKSFEIGFDDDIVAELEKINGMLEKLPCDSAFSAIRIDLNFEFHCKLYSKCAGTLIYDLYSKNYSFIKAARKYFNIAPERNSRSVEEHSEIISAIKQNDLQSALVSAEKHTKSAGESCIKAIHRKDNDNEGN